MRLARSRTDLPPMNIGKRDASKTHLSADLSREAFEQCFESYWASIYGLLRRMLGDPAEAEDLALETFYRLYARKPAGEPIANSGGWLYRVATHLGLHSIRAWKRREHYEAAAAIWLAEEAPEDRPAELVASEEQRNLARQVLAGMQERQSQLLIMRHSGMSYKDIAAALDLSPTSIGPLLVRAEAEFEKRYRALVQEDL